MPASPPSNPVAPALPVAPAKTPPVGRASGSPAIGGSEIGGFERWLRSPFRVSLLALAAVSAATAATALGEVELRSAGGFGAEDAEVLVRQFGMWSTWALLTPLIVAASTWLGRRAVPWPLTLLIHAPIAALVAGALLLAEIKIQEVVQGPEETARLAEVLEWQESMNELRRRAAEEGRDPWSLDRGRGRRGGERSGGDRSGAGRSERRRETELDGSAPQPRATGSSGADAPRAEPPPGGALPDANRPDANRPGGRDDDPRRGWSWRRFRDRGPAVNVATGDLLGDFGRRWRLRVPRYVLVYFTLLGIGLGIRAYLQGRTKEREAQALAVRASQLETDLTAARLETLKGQLHPHFLFNALHSVGGLVRADRSHEAVSALDTIGDLLRTSLDSGPEQFVTLDREVELIERYLAVESLRLGERLTISIDVPESLREAEVPAFIAQPLVENAIKHGIAMRPEGGSIAVRAFAEDEATLVIDVEDDGPGLSEGWDGGLETSRGDGRGVGLRHVTERLDALFADGGSLVTENLPNGGMRARLRLPLDELEPPHER